MIDPPQHILRVPGWERIPHLVHGFCGRRGGVSRGAFAELNLSLRVGDEAEAVHENWRRVSLASGMAMRFATMRQVHGTNVATIEPGTTDGVDADALVTCSPGVALSVLTADCVPILLVAPRHEVVAAVHAGWRGTLAGIVTRTLQHLETTFGVKPAAVHAALGPAIGGCCYEVDRSIVDDLERAWGAMPGAVRRRPHTDKAMLDLRSANAAVLADAGVAAERIAVTGPCTRCAVAEYFSYRASALASTGGAVTGRQLSFIGWQN